MHHIFYTASEHEEKIVQDFLVGIIISYSSKNYVTFNTNRNHHDIVPSSSSSTSKMSGVIRRSSNSRNDNINNNNNNNDDDDNDDYYDGIMKSKSSLNTSYTRLAISTFAAESLYGMF